MTLEREQLQAALAAVWDDALDTAIAIVDYRIKETDLADHRIVLEGVREHISSVKRRAT